MLAIADERMLYLLEFESCPHLEKKKEQLQGETQSALSFGRNKPLDDLERELDQDGALGGYASGIERKAWLLKHEVNDHLHMVRSRK